MRENIYAYVMAKLDARDIPLARVSREVGIPYESLKKIAHRRTPNPGVKHVQVLADFFDRMGDLDAADSEKNKPLTPVLPAQAAINCVVGEVA